MGQGFSSCLYLLLANRPRVFHHGLTAGLVPVLAPSLCFLEKPCLLSGAIFTATRETPFMCSGKSQLHVWPARLAQHSHWCGPSMWPPRRMASLGTWARHTPPQLPHHRAPVFHQGSLKVKTTGRKVKPPKGEGKATAAQGTQAKVTPCPLK